MFYVSTHAPRRAADLSRLLDNGFDRFFSQPASAAVDTLIPALDVTESAQGWTVKIDLPGLAKEDVKVSIDGKKVSVEASAAKTDEPKEGDRPVHRERQVKRYARSLTLPAEVAQAESAARMENGVLTLSLAKKLFAQAGQLTIN